MQHNVPFSLSAKNIYIMKIVLTQCIKYVLTIPISIVFIFYSVFEDNVLVYDSAS